MLDHTAAQLALRSRLLTLSVCSTGPVTMASSATGGNGGASAFVRTDGSFVDDGFAPGMESVSAGFDANNVTAVVTHVSDTVLSVDATLTDEAAAFGRTLTVGLPAIRAWENVELAENGEPVEAAETGRPYIEEEYLPATQTLRGVVQSGTAEETGIYLIRWYGVQGTGIRALRDSVGALLRLFPMGASVAVGDGTAVRIRGNPGPRAAEIVQDGTRPVISVSIPWYALTRNAA